jgi:ASC-1-like (ASCH) protein
MKILHLTLKKQWFDMIASGEKREECREMKPCWHKRLLNKKYDAISFRNGHSKNAPAMLIEFKLLLRGAPEAQPVYMLRLGEILTHN